MSGEEVFLGHVKSYNATKGYGFFECPEAFDRYGKDILIPKSSVPEIEGRELHKGDRFTFSVTEGRTGPIATNLVHDGLTGVVKSFNSKKGFGFIASEQYHALYGKDILVQKGDFEKAGLSGAGQEVRFQVAEGRNGAIAVELKLLRGQNHHTLTAPMAKVRYSNHDGEPPHKRQRVIGANSSAIGALPEPTGREIFQGVVKSFNAKKGWGFISSEQIMARLGKDVMVLQQDLPEAHTEIGQLVQFDLTQGRNGFLAANVELISEQAAWPVRANQSLSRAPSWNTPSSQETLQGVIKSFNPKKGWGFISSENIMAQFGKDIMVRQEDLPGGHAEVGQAVSFSMTEGRTGLLASNLEFIYEPAAHPSSKRGASRSVSSRPGHEQSWGKVGWAGHETCQGVIKSFNTKKGWGFISSPDVMARLGKDIMVRQEDLPDGRAEVGQAVSFSMTEGRTGFLATNVQLISEQGARNRSVSALSSQPEGHRYQGVVKSFNPVKAWGFVTSEEMMDMFGKDVMFQKGQVPDGVAHPGQAVTFSLVEGRNGPLAVNLEFVDDSEPPTGGLS